MVCGAGWWKIIRGRLTRKFENRKPLLTFKPDPTKLALRTFYLAAPHHHAANLNVGALRFIRTRNQNDFSHLVVQVGAEAQAAARRIFRAGKFFGATEAAHPDGQLEGNSVVGTANRA
jgi:hypothetical protein